MERVKGNEELDAFRCMQHTAEFAYGSHSVRSYGIGWWPNGSSRIRQLLKLKD
jgi:hypothetical protein